MSNATQICCWVLQTDLNCDWCFFDDVPNKLHGLCGTKWTKNGVKMKKRRTEKTVRRNFIYMGKASKIAVKQKQWLSPQDCRWYTNGLEVASQPLLRCPKYGGVTPYFDRCANIRSLLLPPAAVACVARHARASFQEFYAQTKNTGTAKAMPVFLSVGYEKDVFAFLVSRVELSEWQD